MTTRKTKAPQEQQPESYGEDMQKYLPSQERKKNSLFSRLKKKSKKPQEEIVETPVSSAKETQTPREEVVVKHLSSAKKTKKPQMSLSDLSHAAMHLLLLIQHAVDEESIKVSPSDSSWDALKKMNPILEEKKMHIKSIFNVHHFSSREKNLIAERVCVHVQKYQPKNVVEK